MAETKIQLWLERKVDPDFDPRERETLLKKQFQKNSEIFEQFLNVVLTQDKKQRHSFLWKEKAPGH